MRAVARLSVLMFGLGLASACGEPAASDSEQTLGEVGTLQLALSATGPDGATYALPADAVLTVERADASMVPVRLDLQDPQATSLRVPLAPGDYVATLEQLVNARGEILLSRQLGGTTQEVSAELLSANPVAFTIASGAVESLPIRFALATLGDVVFDVGTLDVQVGLQDSATPGQARGFVGDLGQAFVIHSYSQSPFGPILGELNQLPQGASVSMHYEVARAGSWELSPHEICAPIEARTFNVPESFAMSVLFNEPLGGTGRICFADAETGGTVRISLQRQGPALNPGLANELGRDIDLRVTLEGRADHAFVADGKLSLTELGAPITLSSAVHVNADMTFLDNPLEHPADIALTGALTIAAQL